MGRDLKKLKQIPNATIVQSDPLTEFIGGLFAAAGMPHGEAVTAAAVLVDADLNGIDSHGVGYNLDLHYLGGLTSGFINPTPDIHITHETPSTAVVDADRGMGLLAGIFAMNVAIEKARDTGTASVFYDAVCYNCCRSTIKSHTVPAAIGNAAISNCNIGALTSKNSTDTNHNQCIFMAVIIISNIYFFN